MSVCKAWEPRAWRRLLTWAAAISLATAAYADPAAVAETEKRFEADAGTHGIGPAFVKYAAADGLMFLPGPVVVRENPRLVDWKGRLLWGPDLIIASASEDLYVSTGPAVFVQPDGAREPNVFVTLWQRQPDGTLRFRIDRGVSQVVDRMAAGSPAARFRVLSGTSSPAAPDIAALDAEIAAAALVDAREAVATRLHPEGRVLRAGLLPAGPAAWRTVEAASPERVTYVQLGSGSSKAQDLAWSYGRATWQEQGKEQAAFYFRAWVFDGERWVIALDEMG